MLKFYNKFVLLILVSCSSRPGTEASRFIPEHGFAADPLNYTEVSRTLIDDRNYLVSYSQDSGRLGIVDADSFQEIWGTYTDRNVPYVFNLPGHEGAGLLSSGLFTVVIKEGSRSFGIPVINGNAWNRASDSIALVAYDSENEKIHAVKYRGESDWEQTILDGFPEQNGPTVAGAVAVSATGVLALVLAPESGSYLIVADDGSKYIQRRACVSSEAALVSPVASAAIDETVEEAFLAVGGKIYRIDLSDTGTCLAPTAWTEAFSGEGDISRIGFLESGLMYALSKATGTVRLLVVQDTVLTKTAEFSANCTEPASVNKFGKLRAVACINRMTNSDDQDKGNIRNVSLKFLSDVGVVELTQKIDFEKKSGIVFNPAKSEFLQIYNSAAGEIDVHTVPTGEIRHVEGIFLNGILNRL